MKKTLFKSAVYAALKGLMLAGIVTLGITATSCEGKESYTVVERNDWQKMGLKGSPREILVQIHGILGWDYYYFNSQGRITEYGKKSLDESVGQYYFKPVDIYTYDADSVTLLSKRNYSYNKFDSERINGYTDTEYDRWGNEVSVQYFSNKETYGEPSYQAQKPTAYTYELVDKRTYEKYMNGDKRERITYDKYRNPTKVVNYGDEGIYNVLRYENHYNNDGLLSAKIDYEPTRLDDYKGMDFEIKPQFVRRYVYDANGVLENEFWAMAEDLPDGWQKDIEGLDAELFKRSPDRMVMVDGKIHLQPVNFDYDDRGNWTLIRENNWSKSIARHFKYWDERGIIEK